MAMLTDSESESERADSPASPSAADPEQALIPGGSLAWVVASSPRHLDKDLEPLHLPLSTSVPNEAKQCTPENLLPSALRKDYPELNFPPRVKRRRICGKSPNHEQIGVVLHRLQNDVSSSLEPLTISWRARRNGFFEYVQDMKNAVGQSKSDVIPTAREHWVASDSHTKNVWGFVFVLRGLLYARTPGKGCVDSRVRIPLPAGVRKPETHDTPGTGAASVNSVVLGKGIGIMRTFNTDWHNQIPELTDIMSSRSCLEKKLEALKQLPFLQDKFAAYEQHVRDHAARLGLPTWGCCFEVSLKSHQTGRIHTHDYAGPSLDCAGYDVPKRVIQFKESDKVWDDMVAFHSLTSARGNVQSKKMRAVAAAMYYVTSEKIGSLFIKCARSPFEDWQSVRYVHFKALFCLCSNTFVFKQQ